eukprot:TRINITY_DN1003_c0_g1_i5.p1 TRINITY_DN1003_c0_g1~~TRINITY_DN1003_c0_g1_i5.p1  ORF type:complete len:276 (-),score=79.67 TRINITY_DN1003_c0_g1_i5:537-1364(-)
MDVDELIPKPTLEPTPDPSTTKKSDEDLSDEDLSPSDDEISKQKFVLSPRRKRRRIDVDSLLQLSSVKSNDNNNKYELDDKEEENEDFLIAKNELLIAKSRLKNRREKIFESATVSTFLAGLQGIWNLTGVVNSKIFQEWQQFDVCSPNACKDMSKLSGFNYFLSAMETIIKKVTISKHEKAIEMIKNSSGDLLVLENNVLSAEMKVAEIEQEMKETKNQETKDKKEKEEYKLFLKMRKKGLLPELPKSKPELPKSKVNGYLILFYMIIFDSVLI